MYSAYKLNKQGDSLDVLLFLFGPVCCSMSSSNCCFLRCIQVSQEASQVVWYSHLFQNFPQFIVIPTVKGFGIVNKAEIDVFLELFCFFHDPEDVGNLISGSSAFSKTSLNIWKFTVHVLLKRCWLYFQVGSFADILTIPRKCSSNWILWKDSFRKRGEYQTTWPASWEICMQVREQQLELDMEQQTGSK